MNPANRLMVAVLATACAVHSGLAAPAPDRSAGQTAYRAAYDSGMKKLRTFPHKSGHLTATIDFAGARANFERALRAAQNAREKAAAHLAIAYTRIHDLHDADYQSIRKEYREVLRMGPDAEWRRRTHDRVEAQIGVAETYLREGDYTSARKALEDTSKVSPHPHFAGDVALVRARLYTQERDLRAARGELERLVAMTGIRDEAHVKQQARQTLDAVGLALAMRSDHPRLFFDKESWPAVKARALGEERDYFEKLKRDVDEISADEVTRGDWGMFLMPAAFVYRVTEDQALFDKVRTMLRVTVDHYLGRRIYNSRSYSRVGWLAAFDWVSNDLTPSERGDLAARMTKYVYGLYTEDLLRRRLPHQPWYYERNVWWYAGLALLSDGLDDVDYARVLAVLGQGYGHNRALFNEYRERGGDDGAWHLNLEYSLCELPTILWAFMHTWRSALGADVPDEWLNVGLPVDYVLRNVVGVEPTAQGIRHFGYSRSWGRGSTRHELLHSHLGHFLHFFGQSHPEHAGIARHLRERIRRDAGVGQGQYPVFPFLLANLPKAPPANVPSDMPTARHFENVGLVLMSSGWERDDTYALFAVGGGTLASEHRDASHFTIYKRGHLALDSGARGAGAHSTNYWSQTVAHNCVLIRMPGEAKVNSGGQEHSPNAAEVLAFETGEHYSYAATDATATYSPDQCAQMVRQLVFLPPNHVVVFDRVTAVELDFTKRWLLHTAREPVLEGQAFHADGGQSRLFCRTLYPRDAVLTKVGGPGREFVAGGANWPIPKSWNYWRQVRNKIPESMGHWRVEVSLGSPRRQDCFLHLIQASDQTREKMSAARLLDASGGVGLSFTEGTRTYEVRFSREGEVAGHVRILEEGEVCVDRDLAGGVMPQSGLALISAAQGQTAANRRTADPFAEATEQRAAPRATEARSLETLLAELRVPEWGVRRQAVWGLGRMKATRAVAPLMAALRDENWRVRSYAAWALSQVGAPAVQPLAAALRDAAVQDHAAQALAAIGEPAVEPLLAALSDDAGPVRSHAADALGQIADARATRPLMALLEDDLNPVRCCAARALGKLGRADALAPLIGMLRDRDVAVRRSAAEGLGEMGDPRAVQSLIAALSDEDASVRRSAAVALGPIGDRRAVEPLIAAMGDASRTVCLEAHASLVTVTGHKMHIGLDWPAETIRQYRQPRWQQWWERNRGAVAK